MLKIDRLVLRLPADYARRGESLARAVAAELGGRAPAHRSATLSGVAPGASDKAVANVVARALGATKGRP